MVGYKISTLQKEEECNEYTELLERIQSFCHEKSVFKYKEVRNCTLNLPQKIPTDESKHSLIASCEKFTFSDQKLKQVVTLIDEHIVEQEKLSLLLNADLTVDGIDQIDDERKKSVTIVDPKDKDGKWGWKAKAFKGKKGKGGLKSSLAKKFGAKIAKEQQKMKNSQSGSGSDDNGKNPEGNLDWNF